MDVLRKKGYELDGKRVVDGQKVPGLRGALEVMIHAGRGMTNPYEDLLRDAQTTVEALEKMHQQAPIMRSQSQQNFRPAGHAPISG